MWRYFMAHSRRPGTAHASPGQRSGPPPGASWKEAGGVAAGRPALGAGALADGHIKCAAAAVLDGGLGEAHDMRAHRRLAQPMRHEAAEHAALLRGPEIAPFIGFEVNAFAGDDEHMTVALRLAAGEEVAERGMSIALTHAVKIEPRIDLAPAACDALGGSRVERLGRRRLRGPVPGGAAWLRHRSRPGALVPGGALDWLGRNWCGGAFGWRYRCRAARRRRASGSSWRVTLAHNSSSSCEGNRLRLRPSIFFSAGPRCLAPWPQYNEFATVPDTPRETGRIGAHSRENVAALRSGDSRARVLDDEQPPERRRLKVKLWRHHPYRSSGCVVKRIGRQAAPWLKLRARGASGRGLPIAPAP